MFIFEISVDSNQVTFQPCFYFLANGSDITEKFDDILEPAKTYFLQVTSVSRSKRSNSPLFRIDTNRKYSDIHHDLPSNDG